MSQTQNGLLGTQSVIIDFPDGGEKINFNNQVLSEIFENEELRDRKAVVVSIVGPFRKGKSLLMDYFLRYLYFTYKSVNSLRAQTEKLGKNGNWIGLPDTPLTGFSWKGGVEKDTYGIVMWSDVFLHESNDEKYAIILIDTQGLFDHDTPEIVNGKIFTFTTLMSSVLILNLPNIIQENQLQYLQFATEFARFLVPDQEKAFQHLCILLRDWGNSEDYNFGFDGGNRYLDEQVLKIRGNQLDGMKEMRQFIRDSFDKISCFLMPHPGPFVREAAFNGSWGKLSTNFVDNLKVMVSEFLSPENLKPKKINGKAVTISEYFSNLRLFENVFSSKDLPKSQSIYESSVALHMNGLIQNCAEQYVKLMAEEVRGMLVDLDFENIHLKNKEAAIEKYKMEKKMGTDNHIKFYENLLIDAIEKHRLKFHQKVGRVVENYKLKGKVRNAEDQLRLENELAERRELELTKQIQESTAQLHVYQMNANLLRLKQEKEREIHQKLLAKNWERHQMEQKFDKNNSKSKLFVDCGKLIKEKNYMEAENVVDSIDNVNKIKYLVQRNEKNDLLNFANNLVNNQTAFMICKELVFKLQEKNDLNIDTIKTFISVMVKYNLQEAERFVRSFIWEKFMREIEGAEILEHIFSVNVNLFNILIENLYEKRKNDEIRDFTSFFLSLVENIQNVESRILTLDILIVNMMKLNDSKLFGLAHYIKTNDAISGYLKEKLPDSVKNAIFAKKVYIKNAKTKEYLKSDELILGFHHSISNRYALTTTGKGNKTLWSLNFEDGTVENCFYNEYLCANYVNHYSKHNWVYTNCQRKRDLQNTSYWRFELFGKYICIKNIYHNEYMAVSDDGIISLNIDRVGLNGLVIIGNVITRRFSEHNNLNLCWTIEEENQRDDDFVMVESSS